MTAGSDAGAREDPRQDPRALRGAAKMQRGGPDDVPEERRAAGYEISDAPARGVLYATIGFFVALVLIGIVVWALLAYFREALDEPVVTDIRAREIVPLPPRLEIEPERTRAEIEDAARAMLEGYGWADREAGIVRVPVEEAMRLLAGHGWPDGFDAEEVVVPRATVQERVTPRAAATLTPVEPGAREGEP